MNKNKIFIACPISKYLNENGMDKKFESFIKDIYNTCCNYSNNVFMALYREKFGQARMEDDECTPLDFMEMKDADYVIAIPEDSMGVAVELGWASAMEKNIFLVINKKFKTSPLVNALDTVAKVEKFMVSTEHGYDDVQEEIIESIEQYLKSKENIVNFV